ncbi:MAG: hypothetical protein GY803_09110, partial [Chloroflexi bacterium]|nr:hypothetical protein [Chloroflexota bacterium]
DVPWEGPETGVCRQPTEIGLLTSRARAVQNGGYTVSLFGLFGLFITLTILIWRQKLTIHIEKGNHE